MLNIFLGLIIIDFYCNYLPNFKTYITLIQIYSIK